jgi:site-specific recombinase XerD
VTELKNFKMELLHSELSQVTLKRYMSDITQFIERENIKSKDDITKTKLQNHKNYLVNNLKPVSCIIKLIAINKFLDFLGLDNLKVKFPKK